jgi:hypothetical protein
MAESHLPEDGNATGMKKQPRGNIRARECVAAEQTGADGSHFTEMASILAFGSEKYFF